MSYHDDDYARWVEGLRPQLLRYARERLGGDAAEAEDVVQDATMRALVALRGGGMPVNPRAWMYVIVRNRCHDVRGARRPVSPLEDAFDIGSSAPGPDEAVAARRQLGAVVDAIGALPDAQRRAFVSATFEGRPYEEIAAREATSVQAVKSLVHRARRGLEASGARAAALMPWPAGALREQVAGFFAQHTATTASVAAVAVAVPAAPVALPSAAPPARSAHPTVHVAPAAAPARAASRVLVERAVAAAAARRAVAATCAAQPASDAQYGRRCGSP